MGPGEGGIGAEYVRKYKQKPLIWRPAHIYDNALKSKR